MQKLRWLRENWLQAAILGIPFIVIAALWDRFPDRVVVKWNLSGEPVKWAGKTFGLLVGPCLSVAIALLLGWIPRLDPKLRKSDWDGRSLGIIRLAFTSLLLLVSLQVEATALGYHFNGAIAATNGVLLVFLVLGNYLGTIPPNYFCGIRTPWTLSSDEVWRATHRNAGRIMVIECVAFLGLQFFMPRELMLKCFVATILASFAWSIAYSYWIFRSIETSNKSPP
jgi:uncharacterized membrane protein